MEVKNQYEMSIRIIYKKTPSTVTQIHIAANVKHVIITMMKHNLALCVLSLDHKVAYHPNNNNFPQKEDKSKEILVYKPLTHPALCHQVTIGCIVHATKTVKDIKFNKTIDSAFIDWLCKHKIYIEINALRHEAIHIVGYLLKHHPNITHHDTLKETLSEQL